MIYFIFAQILFNFLFKGKSCKYYYIDLIGLILHEFS